MHVPTPVSLLPLLCLLMLHISMTACAFSSDSKPHATFSVHYPWLTRRDPPPHRHQLDRFEPFCGDFVHNPQPFAGYKPTFLSFSGHVGDLVSVRYTRKRVPRSAADFTIEIAHDVPIAPSGQLCLDDVQMPRPTSQSSPEYGVLLFEARDPVTKELVKYYCSDVKLMDEEDYAKDYPAMCARNNETLVPMPEEWL
ncbi:hypothetical protein EW146_g2625 [Bondarzewia mesenterica]|uniref:Copper acquisition factor BIM1-like domain-containing protein n=1 Tax=Bondarzewia mesenterica TaxID=1095465 RepID=A0A4S4LZZ7_9AGAM|nr:hypothetical protein EW146_g2625 [Bondarzewia mesenterica]